MNGNHIVYIELKYFPIEQNREYFLNLPENILCIMYSELFKERALMMPDAWKKELMYMYYMRLKTREAENIEGTGKTPGIEQSLQEFENCLRQLLIKYYASRC